MRRFVVNLVTIVGCLTPEQKIEYYLSICRYCFDLARGHNSFFNSWSFFLFLCCRNDSSHFYYRITTRVMLSSSWHNYFRLTERFLMFSQILEIGKFEKFKNLQYNPCPQYDNIVLFVCMCWIQMWQGQPASQVFRANAFGNGMHSFLFHQQWIK